MNIHSLVSRCLLSFCFVSSFVQAQTNENLNHQPKRRSDVFVPFMSYLFPGFGQWVGGDYSSGFVYSGLAIGSIRYSLQITHEMQSAGYSEDEINEKLTDLQSKDSMVRKIRLGSQTRDLMGGLSSYESFRRAVKSRQEYGEYLFLTKEEKISEIMTAPFRFKYLKRSSTYVPLGIISVYAALVMSTSDESLAENNLRKSVFSSEDAFYVGATSYNAGVWEEAFFRGWMMPVFMESMNSELWSNLATAGIFALAHASSVPIPIAQALLGFHFGSVTQQNTWTIGEAIFIHAWWDVIALTVSYHFEKINPEQSIKPMLTLPPILISF